MRCWRRSSGTSKPQNSNVDFSGDLVRWHSGTIDVRSILPSGTTIRTVVMAIGSLSRAANLSIALEWLVRVAENTLAWSVGYSWCLPLLVDSLGLPAEGADEP